MIDHGKDWPCSLLRCCLGTLSVVPTLQKLHDFIPCSLLRCCLGTLSVVPTPQKLHDFIPCSLLPCCIGTVSVVLTRQKFYDFTYYVADLEPYQFSCSHAAEIAWFHILRCCLGTLSVQLFPRCRNCTISYITLLPWNPISSVVPTLQKLHDFTYCAAALNNKVCISRTFPMEFHTICCPYRDWNEQQGLHISHISYRISYNLFSIPWLKRTTRFAYLAHFLQNFLQFAVHTVTETNNKVCISRTFPMEFHTICSLYNVVGIFVRLIWKSLDLPSKMLTFQPRSSQITSDQSRSVQINPDQPRSTQISPDQIISA